MHGSNTQRGGWSSARTAPYGPGRRSQSQGAGRGRSGIVVTTAWFGKASHDFAPRHRLELIDGRHLKALLLEYLGIDALIGLPKLPPGWATRDLT
ncbi:restriction endonuclease [Streptomyces sp. NPDC085665]|uniref:restriction endonuclease n=1 Tax=Streptomyces sp. NPDC085665 TaxID=3365735 RepID=UPI0037D65428